MKIYQTGKIIPNALEILYELQPYENFTQGVLKRLDFIIGFVEEYKPTIKKEFIKNLEIQYKNLVKKDSVNEKKINVEEILANFKLLQIPTELAQLSLNFFLQNLQLTDDFDWEKDRVKVMNKNLIHSFLLPRYYNLMALIETLGREEGIKFYKRYITHFVIEKRKTQKSNPVNIEGLFEECKNRPPSEWECYYSIISEGKFLYRNNNCVWADALQDYPDSELKYLICCYGDYEDARSKNDHFILTMEHTIAQGDSYCSRIFHDTRIDYNLKHPPKEFWDNLKVNDE